ncbi:MAG: aldehyde dehydrogenase family protein [Actinomycetaceae bacterium]|nr:aldehyde dehydrogenase family protein [Actinomycetaceae bacterium]
MISPHISESFVQHLAGYCAHLHGKDGEPVFVWTGEKLTCFPTATVDDAWEALDEARTAQPQWRDMSYRKKARVFLQWSELIYRHKEIVVQLSQVFAGKSRLDAVDEYMDSYITPQEVAQIMKDVHAPHHKLGVIPIQTRVTVSYDAIGVVGMFTLADFPVSYGPVDVLQALAAGNAVVQFVPVQAALPSFALRELLEACGLPKGVWQILPAHDISVGSAILDELDSVAFIGNTADGADISQRALDMFIPTAMFLSTKNQAVVFDDVDIDEAVPKAARAVYHMGGQGPCHVERIWVQRGVYQEFLERFEDYVRSEVRVGQSWDHSATLGSLYSLDRLKRVTSHVEDALQLGATLIHGGQQRKDIGPWFFDPTIMTNVPKDALCYDEETYGPVVSIEPFDDIDWLDKELASSQYGYHLVLFTHNPAYTRKLVRSTTSGLISVNDAYHAMWGSHGAALAGSRDTGDGVRHSVESITQYMKSHAQLNVYWGTLDPTWTHTGFAYEHRLLAKSRFRQVMMRLLNGYKM